MENGTRVGVAAAAFRRAAVHQPFFLCWRVSRSSDSSGRQCAPPASPGRSPVAPRSGTDVFVRTRMTGTILQDALRDLPTLVGAFTLVARATGLHLKLGKCCMVPLRVRGGDDAAITALRRIVAVAAPTWSDVPIATSARYLGVLLGPGASADMQWAHVLAAVERRTAKLATAKWAPSTATREWNLRVAPLVTYVAQVVAPTPLVGRAGRVAATRLAHLPHNSLPEAAWRHLDEMGMLQPRM